jgi:small glutamine-rich tetratricopeptide repeat-containing protein alpha
VQIIEEAFALTAASNATYSLKPSSLSQLVQVYQKTKAASTSAPTASASKPTSNARDKAAAEDAKTKGNQAMAAKNYQAAIDAYGEAIAKDDANPVYYSNRAAAYSQMGKQDEAIADAQKAAEVDPAFSKAYSRLGHAYYCAGKFAESVEAYEKGLELDPDVRFFAWLLTGR